MSDNTARVRTAQNDAYSEMVGTRITVTSALVRGIAKLMASERHFETEPDPAVTIAWHSTHDRDEWLVTFEVGYGSVTYVINDETGEYQIAALGERA
jgi:hypothetical protein